MWMFISAVCGVFSRQPSNYNEIGERGNRNNAILCFGAAPQSGTLPQRFETAADMLLAPVPKKTTSRFGFRASGRMWGSMGESSARPLSQPWFATD